MPPIPSFRMFPATSHTEFRLKSVKGTVISGNKFGASPPLLSIHVENAERPSINTPVFTAGVKRSKLLARVFREPAITVALSMLLLLLLSAC